MNLKDILLSKRRQIKKSTFHFIAFDECNIMHISLYLYNVQNRQTNLLIKVKTEFMVVGGVLIGYGENFWSDGNIPNLF